MTVKPIASDEGPFDELQVTALHEAAHAVAAVSFGVQVTGASIRREPGSGHLPPSLGHVCFWRHPDPRPEDCWEGSHWTTSWVMTSLAGYVLEEELEVRMYFQQDLYDNAQVLGLLRHLMPRRAVDGMRVLEGWLADTRALLAQPQTRREIEAAADLLLEMEVVNGTTFYDRLYGGECNARHPQDAHLRCQKRPHRFGHHCARNDASLDAGLVTWPGLPRTDPNERVRTMSTKQRNLRAVNRGEPSGPLPVSWLRALDRLYL